jgi:hypothetical protein
MAIVSLVLAFLLAPLAAMAQQAPKVPRVGVLGERSSTDPFLGAFRQGLCELGYTDGQSIVVTFGVSIRHRGTPERVVSVAVRP